MKERPILFKGEMVRAILNGTKTQTRRAIKSQPYCNGYHFDGRELLCHNDYLPPSAMLMDITHGKHEYTTSNLEGWESECPYGQVGGHLWVRESFWRDRRDKGCVAMDADGYTTVKPPRGDLSNGKTISIDGLKTHQFWRKHPSIHMPRWASRITLEITGVRVERLQEISEADAKAEGCESLHEGEHGYVYREEHDWNICPKCGGTRLHNTLGYNLGVIHDVDCRECDTYVKRYRHLWESINGVDSWNANPWVWVIEFSRVGGAA